jgi:hypothetical protein
MHSEYVTSPGPLALCVKYLYPDRSGYQHLQGTFEALNQTSARVQELQAEPALDSVQQISDLRKQLVKKDRRQEEKIKEIERQFRASIIEDMNLLTWNVHVSRELFRTVTRGLAA